MDIITVSSPDKLSLLMFLRFLKQMGFSHPIVPIHSLMSPEAIDACIEDSLKKFDKVMFSFYAKRKINKDLKQVIPAKLNEKSQISIWFDLFSTKPVVIKDDFDNFKRLYSDKWSDYLKRLGV